MWAIEGAMLDFADVGHMIFSRLKLPMVEAAHTYTRENSLHWEWIESNMRVAEDADIDLSEAFKSFKDYTWRIYHKRTRDRQMDFRAALKAILPDIEILNRTKGPHKNRVYIKGLGFAQVDFSAAGNVVDINGSGRRCPG